jgi:hypothetical protein
MYLLTATLLTAQQAKGAGKTISPIIHLEITQGASYYVFNNTGGAHSIISVPQNIEREWSNTAVIQLDNSDGYFSSLNLQGADAVLFWGMVSTAGTEWQACSPFKVLNQQMGSVPGRLSCSLVLIGIPDLLALERASADYLGTTGDGNTIKDLIVAILDSTLAPFTSCKDYSAQVNWDSEDSLIDAYTPGNSYGIRKGESRLSAITKILNLTKNVMRFEWDVALGLPQIHFLVPVVSGTTYDYEYSLLDESGAKHTFYNKTRNSVLVQPNYVEVKSRDTDSPTYTGYATDATSYAFLPMVDNPHVMLLASNAQGTAIATAIMSHYQMNTFKMAAIVPMNVGQQLYDYVRFWDSREGDIVGNVTYLNRVWNPQKRQFTMELRFGSQSTNDTISALNSGITQIQQALGKKVVYNPATKQLSTASIDSSFNPVVTQSDTTDQMLWLISQMQAEIEALVEKISPADNSTVSGAYLPLAGGVMSGDIDMDGSNINNSNLLPLSGGTMSGDIDMDDTAKVINLAAPVNPNDAARLTDIPDVSVYLLKTGGTMSGAIDMGGYTISNAIINTVTSTPTYAIDTEYQNTSSHLAFISLYVECDSGAAGMSVAQAFVESTSPAGMCVGGCGIPAGGVGKAWFHIAFFVPSSYYFELVSSIYGTGVLPAILSSACCLIAN